MGRPSKKEDDFRQISEYFSKNAKLYSSTISCFSLIVVTNCYY